MLLHIITVIAMAMLMPIMMSMLVMLLLIAFFVTFTSQVVYNTSSCVLLKLFTTMTCCLCSQPLRPCVHTQVANLKETLSDNSVHYISVCGACMREIWRDESKLEDVSSGPGRDNLYTEFWNLALDEIWKQIERRYGVVLYNLRYV